MVISQNVCFLSICNKYTKFHSSILHSNNSRKCDFWLLSNASGVTLRFEHSPSQASEIEYFEIFSCLQQNQPPWQFSVKFNLLLLFLILWEKKFGRSATCHEGQMSLYNFIILRKKRNSNTGVFLWNLWNFQEQCWLLLKTQKLYN